MRQSDSDLDAARYNLAGGFYNIACLLSQQAAEKALKAYLYAYGEGPSGHSIAELCRAASKRDAHFSAFLADAAELDAYYTPTRYPDAIPHGIPAESFEKGVAERAVNLARAFLDFVKSRMPR